MTSENTASASPTFEDLQRVHALAAEKFPHEYLDVGLGAVGLFLCNPPKHAGYQQTPVNSISFGGIGVDGIHFSSVTDGTVFDPAAPVVMTIPMSFDDPNFIVGGSLREFLCLGCRHGYFNLGNVHLNREKTMQHYSDPPGEFYDDRSAGILDLMCEELGLEPWTDLPGRFEELQLQYKNRLHLPPHGL